MALETSSVNCPSCGAPVELRHRFVKLAVCAFCRQAMHVSRDGADPTGKSAELSDFASMLSLNARGTLRGRAFQAVGRLQFSYEDGYWDEWYLMFDDGGDGWLHEDEGELTLVHKEHLEGGVPAFDQIRVGARFSIGGRDVFVSERGRAEITGGQGQLPMRVRPGETLAYVDGNASGRVVMLEYAEDGVEFSVGEPVDIDDLEVEETFA